MILVDRPYVSKLLEDTIIKNNIPTLSTIDDVDLIRSDKLKLLNSDNALEIVKGNGLRIYSNSENTIDWITKNLKDTYLPEKINLFKDKVKFRELLKVICPNFYYKKVKASELKSLSIDEIRLPFIIKPAVGFFSMGVHKVSNINEWDRTIELMEKELEDVKGLYPEEVMDAKYFIIEECIEGEEYAIDAYFDSNGNPVILGILKHIFSSGEDVSDRVYITSKEIINTNMKLIEDFLCELGKLTDLKNFPLHLEVRIDENDKLLPIEVNPMRFAGWCTTDIAYYAYDINTYEYFIFDKKPDWNSILKNKDDKIYAIIVLDNSTGIPAEDIKGFDYDKLILNFGKIHELRKVDYKNYPVFGFIFTETSMNNYTEIDKILKSDLKEYLIK